MIKTLTINGLTIGQGTDYSINSAKGFGSGDVRLSSYNVPAAHRSQVPRTFWGARRMRLEVFMRSNTPENYETLRDNLFQAYDLPRIGTSTAYIETTTGREVQIDVQLGNPIEADFEAGLATAGKAFIDLIAPDPVFYSQETNEITFVSLSPTTQTLTNAGNAPVYFQDAEVTTGGEVPDSWTVQYDANELPENATPAWSFASMDTVAEINPAGNLHVLTGLGGFFSYDLASPSVNPDASVGFALEFRMKGSDAVGDYGGIGVNETSRFDINSPTLRPVLRFGRNLVNLHDTDDSLLHTALLDTFSDFHVYRITFKGIHLKFYIDGILEFETDMTTQVGSQSLSFNSGTGSGSVRDVNLDYIYWRDDGDNEDTPEVTTTVAGVRFASPNADVTAITTLENETTGETLTFTGEIPQFTDVDDPEEFIAVNMEFKMATNEPAGTNALGGFSGQFWKLRAGDNTVTIDSDGDPVRYWFVWRDGWTGI